MKHIVHKAFWNYEKEEEWLNEMSAKGMALTDYSWCRYVFKETQNNEYTYRIELLEKVPTHNESIAYIRFLEESGIECVATYMRWIYLRKKSSEGEFDIYSDLESKLVYYKRIKTFWVTFMWTEFMIGILNISAGVMNILPDNIPGELEFFNLIAGIIIMMIGFGFFRLARPLSRKIKHLQKEREIRE